MQRCGSAETTLLSNTCPLEDLEEKAAACQTTGCRKMSEGWMRTHRTPYTATKVAVARGYISRQKLPDKSLWRLLLKRQTLSNLSRPDGTHMVTWKWNESDHKDMAGPKEKHASKVPAIFPSQDFTDRDLSFHFTAWTDPLCNSSVWSTGPASIDSSEFEQYYWTHAASMPKTTQRRCCHISSFLCIKRTDFLLAVDNSKKSSAKNQLSHAEIQPRKATCKPKGYLHVLKLEPQACRNYLSQVHSVTPHATMLG